MIVKDPFHFLEWSALEYMLQIRMPNPNTCKTGSGSSLYPVLKIKPAYFATTWKHSRSCPV